MAQLKAGIAMKACVVRNGRETEIEARELVAGDIVGFLHYFEFHNLRPYDHQIILEEGNTIPADAKVRFPTEI